MEKLTDEQLSDVSGGNAEYTWQAIKTLGKWLWEQLEDKHGTPKQNRPETVDNP